MSNRASLCKAALPLLLTLMAGTACRSLPATELTSAERDALSQEIMETLAEYRSTALRQDLDASESLRAFLDFYSRDVVVAGDGLILGGYGEWSEQLSAFIQARERMISWEWHNVHIDVLARNAATATFEFEHSELTASGDTVSARGAWTYIFGRDADRWRIIHTNGTRIAS